MTSPKPWKLGHRMQIDEQYPDDPDIPGIVTQMIVRYAQVGIHRRGLFTGYVHDYHGGGTWIDAWFLDGQRFENEDYETEYFTDDPDFYRTLRRTIDAKYPGLTAAIHAHLKQHIIWRDHAPFARPYAREKQKSVPPDFLLSQGHIIPINIGNTMFDIKANLRDPLIVFDNGEVHPLKDHKKVQARQAREEMEKYPY